MLSIEILTDKTLTRRYLEYDFEKVQVTEREGGKQTLQVGTNTSLVSIIYISYGFSPTLSLKQSRNKCVL